ncbi:F-box-like protein [Ceratobasidium sp. AG-Ba]|nr:F-box-like protein [Ceratobasidium sp. AG-Ba]
MDDAPTMPSTSAVLPSRTPTVNHIATELLVQIFTMAEELDEWAGGFGTNGGSRASFGEVASHVCRCWRFVALGMPILWSSIRIDSYRLSPRVIMHLNRSGDNIPLKLELHLTESLFQCLTKHSCRQVAVKRPKYLADLVGLSSRWAALEVWSKIPWKSSYLKEIAQVVFINGCLKDLRTLKLVATVTEDYTISSSTMSTLEWQEFLQNPSLRYLSLTGIAGCDIPFDFLANHASNLVRLELSTCPTASMLRQFLQRTPRLEYLTLDASDMISHELHGNHSSPGLFQVKMPFLHWFDFKPPSIVDCGLNVLQMIDAPNLQNLSLDIGNAIVTQLHVFLYCLCAYISEGRVKGAPTIRMPFLLNWRRGKPLYPELRYLSIRPLPKIYDEMSAKALTTRLRLLLRACKALVRLDWKLGDLGTPYKRVLLEVMQPPLLCPQLKHLRVYGASGSNICKIVRARLEQGVPLKVVEVDSRDWGSINDSSKRYLKEVLDMFNPYS